MMTAFTVVLALIVAAFLLTVAVFNDSPTLIRFDASVDRSLEAFKTPGWSTVSNLITFFGGPVGIALASVLTFLFTHGDLQILYRGAIAVGGSAILVQILKILIARMRPEQLPWRAPELEFSYPSGHTTAATALYGFIGIQLSLTLSGGFLWLIPAAIAAILVGVSRMTLSVHHASDILGGFLFGVIGILAAFILA